MVYWITPRSRPATTTKIKRSNTLSKLAFFPIFCSTSEYTNLQPGKSRTHCLPWYIDRIVENIPKLQAKRISIEIWPQLTNNHVVFNTPLSHGQKWKTIVLYRTCDNSSSVMCWLTDGKKTNLFFSLIFLNFSFDYRDTKARSKF